MKYQKEINKIDKLWIFPFYNIINSLIRILLFSSIELIKKNKNKFLNYSITSYQLKKTSKNI